MSKDNIRFSLQYKNGDISSWTHKKWFDEEEKAIQASQQLMRQKRGKVGVEWYQTRVAVIDGQDEYGRDKWLRIYPKKCKDNIN